MAKPKKTEAQRLEEDTPAYLRFQESASTSASAFDDKPSPGNDGQDDTPPPSPTLSTSTQLPDPQPTPSLSGFLSSVSEPSKPKPISKSLAKALGLDDDSWQKFLLTAELTGGKGQYTQWVHCELIVGSETIYPAHTQRVNGGHI